MDEGGCVRVRFSFRSCKISINHDTIIYRHSILFSRIKFTLIMPTFTFPLFLCTELNFQTIPTSTFPRNVKIIVQRPCSR